LHVILVDLSGGIFAALRAALALGVSLLYAAAVDSQFVPSYIPLDTAKCDRFNEAGRDLGSAVARAAESFPEAPIFVFASRPKGQSSNSQSLSIYDSFEFWADLLGQTFARRVVVATTYFTAADAGTSVGRTVTAIQGPLPLEFARSWTFKVFGGAADGYLQHIPSELVAPDEYGARDFLLPGWSPVLSSSPVSTSAGRFDYQLKGTNGFYRNIALGEVEALYGFKEVTAPVLDVFKKDKRTLDELTCIRADLLREAWPLAVSVTLFDLLDIAILAEMPVPRQPYPLLNCPYTADTRQALNDARAECPYMKDRASRGLDVAGPVPPDWADLWAHLAARGSAWAQGRQEAHEAIKHKGRLPRGMAPRDHALAAALLPAPYLSENNIADDMDFALRTVFQLGEGIGAWRRAQFEKLKAFAAPFAGMKADLDRRRGFCSNAIAKGVNLCNIPVTSYSIGWPDNALGQLVAGGATIIGALPEAGIYRKADVTPSVSKQELLDTNAEWVDQIMARRPPPPEQVAVVWSKSQEEIKTGTLRGFWAKEVLDAKWGVGGWRPLIRFAIWQAGSGKWRVIDNGKSASHNDALGTSEKIHTTSVDTGVAVMRRARTVAGRRLAGCYTPKSSTQDMKRAFRQIPVRDQDRPFHAIAVYSPDQEKWVFGELDGLAFGLGAAVLEFNRVPIHVVALARRWLAIPVMSFYDDFRIFDIEASGGNADEAFAELIAWLGWILDPEKHQPPASLIKLLGINEDASVAGQHDIVKIVATEDRRISLLSEVIGAYEAKRCPPGDAAHIVGRLIHYAAALPGKIGSGLLAPLSEHSRGSKVALSAEALLSLSYHRTLLLEKRERIIPLGVSAYKSCAIITDASWGDAELSPLLGKICFLVLGPDPAHWRGGVVDIEHDSPFVQQLLHRKTQIIAAELAGPLLALVHAKQELRSTASSFYIDNMSGMCSLIKGSSRREDLSAMSSAIHVELVRSECRPWFDYVETRSNSADGGSRVGLTDPIAAQLGIKLVQLRLPAFPAGFPFCDPDMWIRWWDSLRE